MRNLALTCCCVGALLYLNAVMGIIVLTACAITVVLKTRGE